MPRKQRRPKLRRHVLGAALTRSQTYELQTGFCWCDPPAFATDEERRAAWCHHRKDILATYIQKYPGRRPWGFWEFDHPGMLPEDEGPLSLSTTTLLLEMDAMDDDEIERCKVSWRETNRVALVRAEVDDPVEWKSWGGVPNWFTDTDDPEVVDE